MVTQPTAESRPRRLVAREHTPQLVAVSRRRNLFAKLCGRCGGPRAAADLLHVFHYESGEDAFQRRSWRALDMYIALSNVDRARERTLKL